MDRSKTMKGFDVGRSMDFCPLIRCTRSLTRNTSFPKMYNPLLHFRRKRDDVFYVNLLPSTKLKHSMIVFLQSLTLQKLPCDHIHVTGFDDLTQVCRVTQDQRIEMSVLDQIGRKDFPNWMQVVKHSLLGMHGYTLRYKLFMLLCIFPYFSQRNAYVLPFFAKLLVDVGTPIPMRKFWRFARRFQVRECESSRGSGDHGVFFLGDGTRVSKEWRISQLGSLERENHGSCHVLRWLWGWWDIVFFVFQSQRHPLWFGQAVSQDLPNHLHFQRNRSCNFSWRSWIASHATRSASRFGGDLGSARVVDGCGFICNSCNC